MRLLESSLPRMNGDTVRQHLAKVAEALYERSDELATDLARAITHEVRLYQASVPLPFEIVVDGCATNMRSVLEAIAADTEFDTSAATKLGIERARDGVPLASVMEAYRIGFRGFWDAAVKESAAQADRSGAMLRVLTAKIFAAQDIFTSRDGGCVPRRAEPSGAH